MLTSDANHNDDDSSFFGPHHVSSEHTHFHAQSFIHLTVWAYIAIGVIVVITSCVLFYAIYSCYQPLRNGTTIVIGETGFNYPGKKIKDDSSVKRKRGWLAGLLRRNDESQDDPLSKQETAQISSSARVTTSRPEPAHIRDVPHIRVHPPRSNFTNAPKQSSPLRGEPPASTSLRDSNASSVATTSTATPSHLSSTCTGTTAAASDIWSNPKLSPVTGPVLSMIRAPTT